MTEGGRKREGGPVRVRESVRRDTGVGGQGTMQMREAEMEVWAGQATES